MISDIKRKAGPYSITETTREFPFGFYMPSGDDVLVTVNGLDGQDFVLDKDHYTVTLNASQKVAPGGTVILKQSIAHLGTKLAITSNVAYTQNLDLHDSGNFSPSAINKEEDRRVIQIQQLYEAIQRCILVPVTSLVSSGEMLQQLLNVASKANEYAELASKTYQEVLETQKEIESLQPEIEADIKAEGATQVGLVRNEGEEQVKRIESMTSGALMISGVGGNEVVWTLEEDVPAGTKITLPHSTKYVCGRHHLRVSRNGLLCHFGINFEEVGEKDEVSDKIKFGFDAKAGDEIDVWISALGIEDQYKRSLELLDEMQTLKETCEKYSQALSSPWFGCYVTVKEPECPTTYTINPTSAAVFVLGLQEEVTTIDFSEYEETEGVSRTLTLFLNQGTGSNKVEWPANVLWSQGRKPILSYIPGHTDVIQLISSDDGKTWLGSFNGGWFN